MPDKALCPICKTKEVDLLDDLVEFTKGFDCPKHGRFRVSVHVLNDRVLMGKPPEDWGHALRRAKKSRQPGALAPCITGHSF